MNGSRRSRGRSKIERKGKRGRGDNGHVIETEQMRGLDVTTTETTIQGVTTATDLILEGKIVADHTLTEIGHTLAEKIGPVLAVIMTVTAMTESVRIMNTLVLHNPRRRHLYNPSLPHRSPF